MDFKNINIPLPTTRVWQYPWRQTSELIGGFDETMLKLQDTDYCWRIQLVGIKLHFLPDAVVHYRLRDKVEDLYDQARLWGKYPLYKNTDH